MKQTQRLKIFGIGFILGCVVVSFIISAKNAKKRQMEKLLEEPQNQTISGDFAEPIPDGVPAAIKAGRIAEFKHWGKNSEQSTNKRNRSWLLKFNHNYTWVQMDEIVDQDKVEYIYQAADQVQVKLNSGIKRSTFIESLDNEKYHYREFHKKPEIHIIGINSVTIDSVSSAISDLASNPLIIDTKPDLILFKR